MSPEARRPSSRRCRRRVTDGSDGMRRDGSSTAAPRRLTSLPLGGCRSVGRGWRRTPRRDRPSPTIAVVRGLLLVRWWGLSRWWSASSSWWLNVDCERRSTSNSTITAKEATCQTVTTLGAEPEGGEERLAAPDATSEEDHDSLAGAESSGIAENSTTRFVLRITQPLCAWRGKINTLCGTRNFCRGLPITGLSVRLTREAQTAARANHYARTEDHAQRAFFLATLLGELKKSHSVP